MLGRWIRYLLDKNVVVEFVRISMRGQRSNHTPVFGRSLALFTRKIRRMLLWLTDQGTNDWAFGLALYKNYCYLYFACFTVPIKSFLNLQFFSVFSLRLTQSLIGMCNVFPSLKEGMYEVRQSDVHSQKIKFCT